MAKYGPARPKKCGHAFFSDTSCGSRSKTQKTQKPEGARQKKREKKKDAGWKLTSRSIVFKAKWVRFIANC